MRRERSQRRTGFGEGGDGGRGFQRGGGGGGGSVVFRGFFDAKLFASPKTVESQLTGIYRKLGVRSRTELAAALAHHQSSNGGDSTAGQPSVAPDRTGAED